VIVGGAVIGSAVAYFLTANRDFKGSVLVVERAPTYRRASTSLSSSSIRTQFSNPINVRVSQFGSEFIRNFADAMQVGDDRPDLGFHTGGYPFLANTEEQENTLRENHEAHRLRCRCGARGPYGTGAFPASQLRGRLPRLLREVRRGMVQQHRVMFGFRNKAREQGRRVHQGRGRRDRPRRRQGDPRYTCLRHPVLTRP
jgi:glycine/D-amino acid oxidase-like deaminating enzyme